MPRTGEANALLKDERKESIMDAALRLFSISGYDTITINDITKAAHCSHGLFYHYFASKEELFHAIMEQTRKPKEINHECDFENETPKYIIESFISDVLSLLSSDDKDCYFFNIILTGAYQKTLPPPPNLSVAKRKPKPLNSILENAVKEGQQEGICIDGDPHFIVKLFISTIRGLFFERIHTTDLKKYEAPKKELLIRMLLK